MPRSFDGTNDNLHCSIGGLSAMTFGTFACIVRRGATGAWHNILGLHNSGGTAQLALEFTDTNVLAYGNASVNGLGTTTFTSTSTWYFIAAQKATGTATPRFHIYNYSTNAWAHEDAAASIGNGGSVSGGTARFGEWGGVDDYSGEIAVTACWSNAIPFTSDGEWERSGLPFTLVAWSAANPSALWVLDQATTGQALGDRTGGGADQSSQAGNTVGTSSVPVFSYGDGPWLVIRPQAAAGVTIDLSGDPASTALTAVDPTVILGSLTLNLSADPASTALTAVDPTVILGSLTINLSADPAMFALTAVDPTVVAGGDLTINLASDPATVAITAVDPTVILGSLTLDASSLPASFAMTAVDPTIILGSLSVDLTSVPAILVLSAVDPVLVFSSMTVDLAADPVVIVMSAVSPTVLVGTASQAGRVEIILRSTGRIEIVTRPATLVEVVRRAAAWLEIVTRSRS